MNDRARILSVMAREWRARTVLAIAEASDITPVRVRRALTALRNKGVVRTGEGSARGDWIVEVIS